jgi:hypothetical protein
MSETQQAQKEEGHVNGQQGVKLVPNESSVGPIKALASGPSGSGKSTFALSFPKVAYAGTEPGGSDVIYAMPELAQNLVEKGEFVPSAFEDIRDTFKRLQEFLQNAHQLYLDGKIETLVLDNLSYLSEMRWMYIDKYEKTFGRNGDVDTRSMYGTLGRWQFKFTLEYLLSFPGNVVVTCHEMMEGDEALKGKADKSSPIVPNVLGGFREKVEGMFSLNGYLECKPLGQGKYRYSCRCKKGAQKNAKNRYGLPEIVEDISYTKIIEEIMKNRKISNHTRR